MANDYIIQSLTFKQLDRQLTNIVSEAVEDISTDFLRTAQARTPIDSHTLERSGTMIMKKSGSRIEGHVSFRAKHRGFNYAVKMDKTKYKLGEKSLQKSGSGVRSQFSTQSLPVGSGYASDTLEKCRDQYDDYIQKQVNEGIKKLGFKK